jgi:hypothetical protein
MTTRMSKAKVILPTLVIATLSPVFAGIDFTPGLGERVLEGIKFIEIYFHENGRTISYEQPRGWTHTGDASRIRFVPPDVPQAFGEMAQAPLTAPQNFDEATMKLLQDRVLRSLPTDSDDVVLVGAEKNPLMINQHETFEVTVAYQLYGEQYHQSVLFMNLSDTQLTFSFISRKTDFNKLHQEFRGSLCSLQWL